MSAAVDILDKSWNISKQGLDIITENNTIKDKSKILKNALDADLKEIGSPILAKETPKGSLSNVVLQIQKVRNVAAPKANEDSQAAPRMLKLVLTDGESYIQAIEISPLQAINRNSTAPGTKLLIKSAKIVSNYLLLESNSCSVLGGKVPSLYEKWTLAKNVNNYNRQNVAASLDGPPAWVNFGCKIQSNIPDKQFKSIENKDAKDNSEFELQRQGAIAEATAGAIKKTFGGGAPAKQAVSSTITKKPTTLNNYKERRNNVRPNTKTLSVDSGEIEKPQKPPEKISLFDFLEDKLDKLPETPATTSVPSYSAPSNSNSNSYNNNYNRNSNFNSYGDNNYHRNQNPRNMQTYRPNSSYNNHNSGPTYNKKYQDHAPPREHQNQSQNNQHWKGNKSQPDFKNETAPLSGQFDKMSLGNSQFASRSLRQHLNLNQNPTSNYQQKKSENFSSNHQNNVPQKKMEHFNSNAASNQVPAAGGDRWNIGDHCVAKYWEDGKFYDAVITAVTEKTCVVRFRGYDNIEEILKVDCLPPGSHHHKGEGGPRKHHTGSMEFRRSARNFTNKRQ